MHYNLIPNSFVNASLRNVTGSFLIEVIATPTSKNWKFVEQIEQ